MFLSPSGRSYTWINHAHTIGCRLDRFYTPRAWRSRIGGFHDSPLAYSDHHFICINITLGTSNPRGRGNWKFNTQLLKSDSFCTAINDFWLSWRDVKSSFTDPRVNTAVERQWKILSLERKFRNILSHGNPNTVADHGRLTEIKTCLQALSDQAV